MHRILPAVLAAVFLAPAARAQTPTDTAPLNTQAKPEDRPATETVPVRPGIDGDAPGDEIMARPTPPPDAAPSGQISTTLDDDMARALVGRPVIASDSREVGRVRDFLRGNESGTLDRMVLDRGGSEPAGALIVIPVQQVRIPASEGELRLTIGSADLEQMEPFTYAGRDEDALVGER